MHDLSWPTWMDGRRELSLTGLIAQALGTVRSDPLAYPVLMHHPELERDARQLVRLAVQGAEAQQIIDAADKYLTTLLHVRRNQRSGSGGKPTERAGDRFALASVAREKMTERIQLQRQLASAQPALF